MNLIDRYVTEVGKNLPLIKGREDIEKELRSTLEDMLEDRSKQAGRSRDETMEIELLKEYGAPQKVAETYNSHPYLIGPRIFPFFIMILKISIFGVVIGMSVVTVVELITQIGTIGTDFIKIILQGFDRIISVSIAAFGYIVVAFAIIERFVPDFKIDIKEEKGWDPESLTKEPHPNAIKRGELIAEIVFTFIGLAILNGIIDIPVFSEAFLKLTPWINVILMSEIALDIYLLRTALWTSPSRIVKILIEAANLLITIIILRIPNILSITAESFQYIPESSSIGPNGLLAIINVSVSISLIIAVLIQMIDLAKAIYGLWKNYIVKE